jgi:hypothetical protein
MKEKTDKRLSSENRDRKKERVFGAWGAICGSATEQGTFKNFIQIPFLHFPSKETKSQDFFKLNTHNPTVIH